MTNESFSKAGWSGNENVSIQAMIEREDVQKTRRWLNEWRDDGSDCRSGVLGVPQGQLKSGGGISDVMG